MITALTRFVFMAAGLLGGYAVAQLANWQDEIGLPQYYVIIVFLILGWSIGYVLGGIVGRELSAVWKHMEERVRALPPSDLLLATVGLIAGLLVALLATQPILRVQPVWIGVGASAVGTFFLAWGGIRVALLKRREFAAAFPALAPPELVPAAERQLLLDTSAVIDARFVQMHELGFLPGRLRVPQFVLAELQVLADSADDTRRARGRRGLDLLSTLEDGRVDVFATDYPDIPDVDGKLMRLAEDLDAEIITVDYNMTKVARVRGIEVLNLNELAAGMRPSFLPGETLRLKLIKPGKESGQAVGYLEDGTMVVVQDGREFIGEELDTEVTSVLQTSAGRMIFARLSDAE
jgi:uncharacterized protein YacL